MQQTNFTWGVLAINSHKSIYSPNEEAQVTMGVLDDQGKTVCENLNLSLIITDPNGDATTYTLAGGGIAQGKDCKKYIYTEIPDYESRYAVKGNGTYTLNLTSQTQNGENTLIDAFLVDPETAFDVSRHGPTRVWPFVKYHMEFTVTARQDYDGAIVEYVPLGFLITPQEGLTVTEESDALKLTWNRHFTVGQQEVFSYEFDAPDISPEFYLLGKLEIGSWSEYREWQIANDAEITIDNSLNDATDEFQASPQVIFVSDQVGYVFYSDSTGTAQITLANTTDGGTTWAFQEQLPKACAGTNEAWHAPAIWYDQWTPGDSSGSKVYIVSTGATTDDLCYTYYDLNTMTQRSGGWVQAITTGQWVEDADGTPSITKATDGQLYALEISSKTPDGFQVFNSSNSGDTWSTTSLPDDNDNLDRGQLLPLNGGDVLLVKQNAASNTMQSKVHYANTSSWDGGWTTADTNWAESTTYDHQWAAALNKNTGDVYLAGTNAVGAGTGDLRVIKYTESSRSWGALTNVVDNLVMTQVAPAIDLNTNNLWVIHANGTAGNTMHVYAQNSTDDGSTWSAPLQLSSVGDDIKYAGTNMMSDERLYAIWYNDDLNDLLGNTIENLIPSTDDGITTLNQSALITLDNQTSDWDGLTILTDTTGDQAGGGSSFDLTNISLANGPTRLFAYIELTGGINMSANHYYRIFITNNESKGNPTTPDTGQSLPFNYTHLIQLNNSKCRVFNTTGGKTGNCYYYNNSNTLEIEAPLKYINVSLGESFNATFETGNWTHRFDLAPDSGSYIQLLINQTKYDKKESQIKNYTNLSNEFRYPGYGSFSVELWAKTTEQRDVVFISTGEEEPYSSYWNLGIARHGTGVLYVRLNDGLESSYVEVPDILREGTQSIGTTTINDNEWHHLVAVRDKTQNQVRGYVDAVLDLQFNDITNNINDTRPTLMIADSNPIQDEYFLGNLTLIGIYNRVLTQEEIQEHEQTQRSEIEEP